MPKCAECAVVCEEEPVVLSQAGHRLNFCSLECLVAHSVDRIRRRIAGQNRRMQRFLDKHVDCNNNTRRAAKYRIS
jgi:hypothetical protein